MRITYTVEGHKGYGWHVLYFGEDIAEANEAYQAAEFVARFYQTILIKEKNA